MARGRGQGQGKEGSSVAELRGQREGPRVKGQQEKSDKSGGKGPC